MNNNNNMKSDFSLELYHTTPLSFTLGFRLEVDKSLNGVNKMLNN